MNHLYCKNIILMFKHNVHLSGILGIPFGLLGRTQLRNRPHLPAILIVGIGTDYLIMSKVV